MATNKFIKQVNNSKLEFADRQIKSWYDVFKKDYEPFVVCCEWISDTSINIGSIIGTKHPDYIGLTWREFIKVGKRMPLNIQLYEQNPDYYYNVDKKLPEISYISIDKTNYYVDADGNHRTAIAKFIFENSRLFQGVSITNLKIDYDFYKFYRSFIQTIKTKNLPLHVDVNSKHVVREDGSGWCRDYFETEFSVVNYRNNTHANYSKTEFGMLVSYFARTNRLIRFFKVPEKFAVLRGI
ncbi:hypothetical protein [Deferribacter abyssi]|uniref:hypothetical protein n=1 Tax=Deferribacter abyssi TaxID=213806 RepID=UPI003C17BECC